MSAPRREAGRSGVYTAGESVHGGLCEGWLQCILHEGLIECVTMRSHSDSGPSEVGWEVQEVGCGVLASSHARWCQGGDARWSATAASDIKRALLQHLCYRQGNLTVG